MRKITIKLVKYHELKTEESRKEASKQLMNNLETTTLLDAEFLENGALFDAAELGLE